MRTTATASIIEQLAHEHRRVLVDWRALILLRRATFALGTGERRWTHLPAATEDLVPLFQQMRRRGDIKPINGFRRLYEVTVPYARNGPLDEREIVLELNPYAVLSHASAYVFHGLTRDLPKDITATISSDGRGGLLPLGTEPRDWDGVSLPGGRTPVIVQGRPVRWIRVKPERFFGSGVYQPFGVAMRVTTPERTLLDGLLDPDECGGITNVFRAWVLARDTLSLDELVPQVERFGVGVLRQRVGFVLDQLDLTDRRVDAWRATARRGGSSRMVAAAPFAPEFSDRWNLSLNAPVYALRDDAA